MLMPKRVKHRKQHRGRMTGRALRGNTVTYGDFGLQAMEPAWVTSQQIEAARIAMMRHIKRGGKVFIRIFPDKTITAKPLEVRQGKGKGSPVGWCAPVQRGRILYEIKGVDYELAKEALQRAAYKLPIKTTIVEKE